VARDLKEGGEHQYGVAQESKFDHDAAEEFRNANAVEKGLAIGAAALGKQTNAVHALIGEALGAGSSERPEPTWHSGHLPPAVAPPR
jgi:hypothetical protein